MSYRDAIPDEKSVRHAKKKIKVRKRPKTDLEKIGNGINRHGRPKKKTGARLTPEEKQIAYKKQEQALELRMSGATYREIAEVLNYANPSSAKFAVDSVIARTEVEAAKDVVALDLARLDEYQMRCTHDMRTNGNLHQIDRLMRIMEMRYRLLGITDETVRLLQKDHGITQITNNKMVMNIHAAQETEQEFIAKMMRATGIDPESEVAQEFLRQHNNEHALPMLEGSANNAGSEIVRVEDSDDDIVEAEIVEELG